MEWKLADAKNRFSEVVSRALNEGPQIVRRRNDKVVVLAQREYEKLTGSPLSFVDYLLAGPGLDDVALDRDKTPMRETML